MRLCNALLIASMIGAPLFAANIKKIGEALLDLDEDEALTVESFSDLANRYKKNNMPYMVARAVSIDAGNRSYTHYFDAQEFNNIVFEGLTRANDRNLNNYANPLNRAPLVAIDYFFLFDPADGAFVYMCSYEDLFLDRAKRDFWKDIFRARQVPLTQESVEAMVRLANRYANGNGIPKNIMKARSYLERVANQTVNEAAAEQARVDLDFMDQEALRNVASSSRPPVVIAPPALPLQPEVQQESHKKGKGKKDKDKKDKKDKGKKDKKDKKKKKNKDQW